MKRRLAEAWTAWPALTEPVNETRPTCGSSMAACTASLLQGSACTRPAGAPAAAKARSKASAHSGVRGECLSCTALPASTAGTTQLTAVSSG